MKKSAICMLILALGAVSNAAIVGYTNTFSTAADTTGWVSVGPTATSISRFLQTSDYNDGDPNNALPYSEGMEITGDGVRADGSLYFFLQNTVPGDEAIGYTLSGTLDAGKTVTVSGSRVSGTSYNYVNLQIWDVTADELLAETGVMPLTGNTAVNYVPQDFSLEYTGTSAVAGHTIQVRFVEDGNSVARGIFIDNIEVAESDAVLVPGYTNTFSTAADTNGWESVGATATGIMQFNKDTDYNDGDLNAALPYSEGMEITGDGMLADGSLYMYLQNATPGDEAIGYTLSGVLLAGKTIKVSGSRISGNSANYVNLQIWDVTDDKALAETGVVMLDGSTAAAYAPLDFYLEYTGTSADAGHVIQIRFVENGDHVARGIFIDNIAVEAVDAVVVPVVGEMLVNTNFSGVVTDWTYVNFWEDNALGGDDTISYTATTNVDGVSSAYSLATGACKDLTQEAAITSVDGYNPATTKLMGFNTIDMGYIYSATNLENLAVDASFQLSVQVDIHLVGETKFYRLYSSKINPATQAEGPVTALTWTWFPAGSTTLGDLTADGGVALGDIESITYSFVMKAVIPNTNGTGTAYFQVKAPNLPYQVEVVKPVVTTFLTWVEDHGLTGGNAAENADPDGDGFDNLAEYGLGGDPTNSADRGFSPASSITSDGGTIWLSYTYPQLQSDNTLTYYLELSTNLVSGTWTNAGYTVLGTNTDGYATGFDAVTNRISTETESQQFIRLRISK